MATHRPSPAANAVHASERGSGTRRCNVPSPRKALARRISRLSQEVRTLRTARHARSGWPRWSVVSTMARPPSARKLTGEGPRSGGPQPGTEPGDEHGHDEREGEERPLSAEMDLARRQGLLWPVVVVFGAVAGNDGERGRRGGPPGSTSLSAGPRPVGPRPRRGSVGSGATSSRVPSVSAPVGQACVQAGSPPCARRGAQNVHLVITPRVSSKRGAS